MRKPNPPRRDLVLPHARILREVKANLKISPKLSPQKLRLKKDVPYWRPKTRGDCVNMPRPCPYVTCRYHLFSEVKENGTIRITTGSTDPDTIKDLPETCVLDVASRGHASQYAIGDFLNVTRQSVQKAEDIGLMKMREALVMRCGISEEDVQSYLDGLCPPVELGDVEGSEER